MCDHRLEITSCVSITLNNHEHSYAEWFKYIDDCSGPDKLALYCSLRKYRVHTAVYNKSYVWMTISNHLILSDTEIFDCSAVCLIFLGQTKYGILCEIKQPSPGRTIQPTPSNKKPPSAQKGCHKTTCKSGTHNTSAKNHEISTCRRKAHTFSESRSQQYGLPEADATTPIPRSRCRSRRDIKYLSLNDGPDEDTPEPPKHKKKVSYPPSRKGPSAGRVAACVSSPEMSPKSIITSNSLKGVQSLPAEPLSEVSLPAVPALTGVPSMPENITPTGEEPDKLPGLASNQVSNNDTEVDTGKGNKSNTEPKETFNVEPLSNEEEMDVVDALLSLSTLRDDSVDLLTENETLMPIGGGNLPIDVAPVLLELDQV